MSLCRPLLSQVHIPKLPHRQLPLSYIRGINVIPTKHKTSGPNIRLSGAVSSRDKFSKPTSPPSPVSTKCAAYLPRSSLPSTARDPKMDGKSKITIETYEDLRRRDRSLVANLPTLSYLYIVTEAVNAKSHDLLDRVVLDILEVYQGGNAKRDRMLRAVMSKDFSLLNRDIVLRVLQTLQEAPNGLDFLTTQSIERLARMITGSLQICGTDRTFLRLLHPLLHARISRYHAPGGIQSVSYRPPEIVYASFAVVFKLLTLSFQQEALDLFQVLVKSRHIPQEVVQTIDDSSGDFKLIISTALIKASLHWNWRALVAGVLTDILDATPIPDQSIIDLNIDAIYALLDTPTDRDIRASGHLVRRVHKHSPVPDTIIRQFYHRAAEKQTGDEAEALYAFTRSPAVLKTHHYPPPQGVALPWLMSHLTSASHRTQLSRILASEVVDDNLPLPLQNRAAFIAATAAQGYGRLSRGLWERYAVGKDSSIVVGNSALMIRMVSLFFNLSHRSATKHEQQQSEQPEDRKVRYSEGEDLEARSAELAAFVDQILQAFQTHHEPLAKAPHSVLTSFARACFIIGKFTEGLDAFRFLLDRKELPDIYDANVALSAVARARPRQAARMVRRMVALGLHPDATTFGTVMHHALLHRDMELVKDMVERMRSLEVKRLSVKSMAGLIRASVAPVDQESRDDRRVKLADALHLIEAFPETNIASSPQIGKYLVYSSLQVYDPSLAFKFWDLCLRESTEWNDREHRFIRRLIATMIHRHRQNFDNEQTFAMLSRLGHGH